MAEEFSYRLKDVPTPSSGSNLVAVKIRSDMILLMDEDLSHGVAENINRTSLPYETDLDQEFCHNSIRHYVNKYEGKPPPLLSEINTLSYVWDTPPFTGHYSVYSHTYSRNIMVSWDITETTLMYVLRRATDPEIDLHMCFKESKAETKRLTSAHTLQAEKYSALELWQQEHRQDMTTAASYSRGLEEQLAAATSKASALDLWQQKHRQEMATAASYSRGLEHQLAAVTSRCNALEAAETSALQCAASPDLCHANTLYAAENMKKVDTAATTEPGTTSEDRNRGPNLRPLLF